MRRVPFDAYLRGPMGCCTVAGPILAFCHSPTLCGVMAWGAPDAHDTRQLVELMDLYRRAPLAHRFDVVLDGSAVERVDADALAVLVRWLADRRAELRERIRLQISVAPPGMTGYVLAGILPLLGESHPFRMTESAEEALVLAAGEEEGRELAGALAAVLLDVQGLDPVLARLRELLRERHGDIAVDEAARRLHVSSRTLQRLLSSSGTSFKEQQMEARLAAATELLRTTEAKIADVAARVGLSERGLSVLFRERMGCTPAELRRKT